MPRKEESAIKLVDGEKRGIIQEGYIGEAPLSKEESPKEFLTGADVGEKRAYINILKQLVPKFPPGKLEKQSLEDLRDFFKIEVAPMVQEYILDKFKDISP